MKNIDQNKDKSPEYFLNLASIHNNTPAAIKAVSLGANPNHLNFAMMNPLASAAQNKNYELISFLLENGADPKLKVSEKKDKTFFDFFKVDPSLNEAVKPLVENIFTFLKNKNLIDQVQPSNIQNEKISRMLQSFTAVSGDNSPYQSSTAIENNKADKPVAKLNLEAVNQKSSIAENLTTNNSPSLTNR